MNDFVKWLLETVSRKERQAILPGNRVEIAPVSNPVVLTAEQAIQMAVRLLDCAGEAYGVVFYPDGREPTTNERHLLNLLSWREKEAKQLKHDLDLTERKILHGCTDSNCRKCAKEAMPDGDREGLGTTDYDDDTR